MSVSRIDSTYLYYYIDGDDSIGDSWSRIWGYNGYENTHWTLLLRPTALPNNAGLVDMSLDYNTDISTVTTYSYNYVSNNLVYTATSPISSISNNESVIVNETTTTSSDGDLVIASTNDDLSNVLSSGTIGSNASVVQDLRTIDRLTLDNGGIAPQVAYLLALKDVEYIDAPLAQETKLEVITKEGFTTDGSISSITMRVGHQNMVYTNAQTDSTLFMGPGYDTVTLSDNLDLPGQQYWTLVRQTYGELKAYNLVTGHYISFESGYKGWTEDGSADYINYGEIEAVILGNYNTGITTIYNPGEELNYADSRGGGIDDNRANYQNIDLRSDYQLNSNSFNLAYFNFIRYTSDNVWVGEATIHDGVNYSTPGSQTVSGATYLNTIGTSRNGTHDLIVAEQTVAVYGNLRLYSDTVASGAYNTFNDVFLGTSGDDRTLVTDGSNTWEMYTANGVGGATWSDRVALYGFSGNDILKGGYGYDYLFGGQSTYDQTLDTPEFGNLVTGNGGADYFGIGNTNTSGTVTGTLADVVITTTNTTRSETYTTTFDTQYATDVIMDWDAGTDTMVVLSNGVAVIGGLYGLTGLAGNNTIDLSYSSAVATSDQDADGARGGDDWDATQTLQYIFDNQDTRDDNSITNEEDITVVNDGLIVARGLDGDDTLIASSGADYLYGNAGVNIIYLDDSGDVVTAGESADRLYYDTRTGKQYVANFESGVDSFYLAKNVIDAFDSAHASEKSWVTVDATMSGVGNSYTLPQAFDQNITFIHSLSYKPLLSTLYGSGPYTNMQYSQVDFLSDAIDTAAGSAMYSIAGGLSSIPFVGWALAIPFYVLGGIFQTAQIMSYDWDPLSLIGLEGIVPSAADYVPDGGDDQLLGNQTFLGSNTHQNATYSLDVDSGTRVLNSFNSSYVYVLDTQSGLKTTNTTLATSTSNGADNKQFLDFFHTVSDGFIPALELNPGVDSFADANALSFDFDAFTDYVTRTDASDYGVYAYFAVHSANETFVYLINSRDNLITNDEAYLVSEIGGLLTSADFNVYDTGDDIYNQYIDHPESGEPTVNPGDATVVTYVPTISSVQDYDGTWSNLSDNERTPNSSVRVNVSVSPTAESTVTVNIYDAMEEDSSTGLPILVGTTTISTGSSTATINDSRTLGQTILRTDMDVDFGVTESNPTPTIDETTTGSDDLPALSEANSFEYYDKKVVYYAETEAAISGGFTVKETSDPWTIVANGPSSDTLYGGTGTDTLYISATSAHLNSASDSQIVGIENITVKQGTGPILMAVTSDGIITNVTIVDAGNDLLTGSYALTFTDTDADAETAPTTTWYANVSGGKVTSITGGSGGVNYSSSTTVSASWSMVGVNINLSNQAESGRAYDFFNDTNGDDLQDAGETGFDLTDGILATTDGYDATLAFATIIGGSLDYTEAAGFNITGGSASDTITGGSGNDTIYAMDGADVLAGGTGDDTYMYSAGDIDSGETLTEASSAGTDMVQTTGSVDFTNLSSSSFDEIERILIYTGATATFTGAQLTGEVIDIGESSNGTTTLDINVSGSSAVNFSTLTFNELTVTQGGSDVWTSFDDGGDIIDIDGDSNANNITATIYSDIINSLEGDDIIDGNNGNDTIYGGSGADTIIGGAGADSLSGEDGNDVFLIASASDHTSDTIIGGNGSDTIRFTATSGTLTLNSTVSDSDNLIYAEISDANGNNSGTSAVSLDAHYLGTNIDVYLEGNDGVNTLRGNEDANNTIYGYNGNDTIYGGLQTDYIVGGDGDDTIYFDYGASGTLSGTDTVYGGAGNDLIDDQGETFYSGANYLDGGTGNDTIYGGYGNDTIYGNSGNDELYGEYDNDTIDGGYGDDTIIGSAGVDLLIGGDGNDHIYGTDGDSIDGGNDTDYLHLSAAFDDLADNQINNIETIFLHDNGSYTINLASQTENFNIRGYEEDNSNSETFTVVAANGSDNSYYYSGNSYDMNVTDDDDYEVYLDVGAANVGDSSISIALGSEDVDGYRNITTVENTHGIIVIRGSGDTDVDLTVEGASSWSAGNGILDWIDESEDATGFDLGGSQSGGWSGYLVFAIGSDHDGAGQIGVASDGNEYGTVIWWISSSDQYLTSGDATLIGVINGGDVYTGVTINPYT